jgi:hypothetical protein
MPSYCRTAPSSDPSSASILTQNDRHLRLKLRSFGLKWPKTHAQEGQICTPIGGQLRTPIDNEVNIPDEVFGTHTTVFGTHTGSRRQ